MRNLRRKTWVCPRCNSHQTTGWVFSLYTLYSSADYSSMGQVYATRIFFFFLESILKNISHVQILPKIDVDPRNHPKFHMRLSILHRKKIRIYFLRFFVSPAKGVPLPGEVAALLRHGSPSISGTRFGRKIMILGAGPKMLHGWRRIISTIIQCDLNAIPAL